MVAASLAKLQARGGVPGNKNASKTNPPIGFEVLECGLDVPLYSLEAERVITVWQCINLLLERGKQVHGMPWAESSGVLAMAPRVVEDD